MHIDHFVDFLITGDLKWVLAHFPETFLFIEIDFLSTKGFITIPEYTQTKIQLHFSSLLARFLSLQYLRYKVERIRHFFLNVNK